LRLNPNSAVAHLCLGFALHEPETFPDAIAAYRKSLELDPRQFVALANLGDAYLQVGRFEEARDALVQAEEINSNDSELHLLLGKVCLKLGRRDEALREREILGRLDPARADKLAKLLDGPP